MDPSTRYLTCCLSDNTLRLYDLHIIRRSSSTDQPRVLLTRTLDPSAATTTRPLPPDYHYIPSPPLEGYVKPKPACDILEEIFGSTTIGGGASVASGRDNASTTRSSGSSSKPSTKEVEASAVVSKIFGKKPSGGGGSSSSSKTIDRWQWESLYRIVTDDPARCRLNGDKLRSLLNNFGAFPDKYRPLIWKFLSRVPENALAYTSLIDRGAHSAYLDLEERYPLKVETVLRRLKTVGGSKRKALLLPLL